MTKDEAFDFFRKSGLKRIADWRDYVKGKYLIQEDPAKCLKYEWWIKMLIEYLGV